MSIRACNLSSLLSSEVRFCRCEMLLTADLVVVHRARNVICGFAAQSLLTDPEAIVRMGKDESRTYFVALCAVSLS